MTTPFLCPCGTQKAYDNCCGSYHENIGSAPTAEALMRSRYSAFALNKMHYIRATQQLENESDPVDDDELEAINNSNAQTNWTHLEILATEKGQADDETGTVTFRAHFQEGQHKGELSEKSYFKKDKEHWLYVSGEHKVKANPAKHNIGRNDPCFCGSGKKFKKCCG